MERYNRKGLSWCWVIWNNELPHIVSASARSGTVRRRYVGRPILTACVDGYSGLCCGYSLSWEGGVYYLRSLMLNVIADKKERCRKFGIDIDTAAVTEDNAMLSDQWVSKLYRVPYTEVEGGMVSAAEIAILSVLRKLQLFPEKLKFANLGFRQSLMSRRLLYATDFANPFRFRIDFLHSITIL